MRRKFAIRMCLGRWLLVVAVLAVSVAVPGRAARAEVLRLLLDGTLAPHQVPILLTVERGHFARAGIEPLLEPSLGSNMATVLVGQRAFDLGHVPAHVAAAAISRGTPIRMVAVYQPRSALALVGLRERVQLDGAKAVEGQRLGISPGTVDVMALTLFRRANNIGVSAMTVVPTERTGKLADLVQGRLDLVVGDGAAMRAALLAQGQDPVTLYLSEQGVPLMGFGFVTHQAMLTENPALLRRGLAALRDGFAETARDPQAACQAVRARWPTVAETDEGCTAALRIFLEHLDATGDGPWGRQSREAWQKMIEAMRAAGEVQGTRPPSFYYSNAVVQ